MKEGDSGVTRSLGHAREDSFTLWVPGVWGQICRINKKLESVNLDLSGLFQCKIEDGKNTKFWSDIWYGDGPLEKLFPRLAALEVEKDCFIADRIIRYENGTTINWRWRKPVREGREQQQLEEITTLCDRCKFKGDSDKWTWQLGNEGVLTVASLRTALDDSELRGRGPSTIINKIVPRKV